MLLLSLRQTLPLIFVLCTVLPPCGASPQGAGSTPVAAAGLSIPSTAVPWALDAYKGEAELVPIHHATIVTNRHMGKNIAGSLAGSFLYRPEMTTEREGEHARAQLHTASPVIYFHVDTDEDPISASDGGDKYNFQLIPAKIVKGRRVVDAMSFNQLTTHAKRKESSIAVSTDNLPGGWRQMTPKSALAPGEYVFLSQPERAEQFATTVYPFGVDAQAPEMTDAVRPAAALPEVVR